MDPYRCVAIRRLSHLHQHPERSALRTGDRHPSRTERPAPHSSGRRRRDDTASRYSWGGHSQLTRRQLPPRLQGPRGPHSRHGHPLVGATRRAPRRQRERRKRRLTATPLPGSWRPQAGHDSHDLTRPLNTMIQHSPGSHPGVQAATQRQPRGDAHMATTTRSLTAPAGRQSPPVATRKRDASAGRHPGTSSTLGDVLEGAITRISQAGDIGRQHERHPRVTGHETSRLSETSTRQAPSDPLPEQGMCAVDSRAHRPACSYDTTTMNRPCDATARGRNRGENWQSPPHTAVT